MEGSCTGNFELSHDFHSVNSWAVSHPPPSPVGVVVTCKDFLKTLDIRQLINSELFGKEMDSRFTWQLRIKRIQICARNYISVMLYLIPKSNEKSEECSISASFQIQMLDAGRNIYRRIGGKNLEPHIFLEHRGWGSPNFCLIDNLTAYHKNLLPDGKLILVCKIWPKIRTRLGKGGAYWREKRPVDHSLELQASQNRKLLQEGFFSDFKIIVVDSNLQNRTILAHRAVLAARSPVFCAMVSNTVLESQLGTVYIEDFDFEVVAAMLEFLYTDSVNKQVVSERPADLFQIADKYLIDDLREICEVAVAKCLAVDNAMEIFYLADLHNCLCLKMRVVEFIEDHKTKVVVTAGFNKVSKENPKLIAELYFLTEEIFY